MRQTNFIKKRTVAIARKSVLAFLIVISLSSCEMRQSTGDDRSVSFLTAEKPYYILYARDKRELKEAGYLLNDVSEKFKTLFSIDPLKITIVLFDDPADLQKYSQKDFKESNQFLPLFSKKFYEKILAQAHQQTVSVQVIPYIGAEVESINDTIRVKETFFVLMKMFGVELEKGDKIISINKTQVTSTPALQKEFEKINDNEKFLLLLIRDGKFIETNGTKLKMEGMEVTPAGNSAGDAFKRQRDVMFSALSHEAGHMWFIAYIDALSPQSKIHKEQEFDLDN